MPSDREAHLAGTTLGERYDLLELLGVGGMGAVYRARDRELDELVALKVIRAELASNPLMLERFRSEVKLARRVTHGNVARTFELGRSDGVVFCTMELVTGESLAHRLVRAHRLPAAEAVAIACGLCDGLAAAHAAGVIHRDIKPDNVLLSEYGRVVLADFGVAALAAAGGELSGTPAYMAPEQARGEPPTPACDVYSVGILIYEMVTGRRAFAGDAERIVTDKQAVELVQPAPGEASPELVRVIGRATARDPAARIATAAELRHELVPLAATSGIAIEPSAAVAHGDVARVVVIGPRARDDDRAYLAVAVHDQVLALLARVPRLRVISHVDPDDRARVVVAFELGDAFEVRVDHDGAASVLRPPLASDRIAATAQAIASAVTSAAAAPSRVHTDAAAAEARDLVLRARYNATARDGRGVPLAYDQIRRAAALLPDDPHVAAVLAIVYVRLAFFNQDAPPDALPLAAAAAAAALAAAPELADAQLAAGHIELNHGNPLVAASRYRAAIARAPHSTEAHECLGRMLVEAGFVDEGVARFGAAMAIAPGRHSGAWDVARAYALDGRWHDYDRAVAELVAARSDRVFFRLRIAAWRGDLAAIPALARELPGDNVFVTDLMRPSLAVYVDGAWAEQSATLLALARAPIANRRRKTFLCQIVAELAGLSGDANAAADLIEHATNFGLFDLHWLERCPLLDDVRALPRWSRLRAPIKRRANAILDALYGDHELGTSDTAIAPSALPG